MELAKTITKITIVFFLFLSYAGSSFSQKKGEKDIMPSTYKPGLFWHFTGLHAPKDTFVHKYDRIHASLLYNTWIGDNNDVQSKWYSIGFNIGALWDQPFGKSPFGIAIGIGFTMFQVHHNGEFAFSPDTSGTGEFTTLTPYSGSEIRTKNQFTSNYIEIPFEFRIRTQGKVKFKFYPGFKFGVRLNSFGKWKLEDGKKFKEFNFPDLNRIRYGPTIRIGLDWFQLYAGYYFSYMFTNSNSPKLQQFEAGITISIL